MLDYISAPHVFINFLYHFVMIYGSNLLTRCPVPVPVFCCLFVSEKLFWEVSRNALKIYGIYFQAETKTEPVGRPEGEARASRRPPGVAHPLAMPGSHLVPSGTVSSCPFTYKTIFDPKYPIIFFQKTSEAAAIANPSSGGFCSSSRHHVGEANQHRRLLHHHRHRQS